MTKSYHTNDPGTEPENVVALVIAMKAAENARRLWNLCHGNRQIPKEARRHIEAALEIMGTTP